MSIHFAFALLAPTAALTAVAVRSAPSRLPRVLPPAMQFSNPFAGLKNPFDASSFGGSKTVQLGTLRVPKMGMGTLNWPLDKKTDPTAAAALQACIDNGVTFFDTAEAYGFGRSEELLADCVAKSGSPVTLATKFAPVPWRQKPSDVVDAARASAARLGVESIDLYQIHFPDIIQVQPQKPAAGRTWSVLHAPGADKVITRSHTCTSIVVTLIMARLRRASLARGLTLLFRLCVLLFTYSHSRRSACNGARTRSTGMGSRSATRWGSLKTWASPTTDPSC